MELCENKKKIRSNVIKKTHTQELYVLSTTHVVIHDKADRVSVLTSYQMQNRKYKTENTTKKEREKKPTIFIYVLDEGFVIV